MPRLIVAIILFATAVRSSAQIHFSDTSNVWTLHYFSSGIIPPFVMGPYLDHYNRDTVVRGTKYRQLSDHTYGEYVLIREDTVLKKVFAIRPVHDTDTTEKLLYDYNLNIGDTFRSLFATYYVDTITFVSIGGSTCKVWDFRHVGGFSPGFQVIEGIGCIGGPCIPIAQPSGTVEGEDQLTCFQNNGANPAISPPFGPYFFDALGSEFYFDNSVSCTLVFESIGIVNGPDKPVTVTPNPAESEITIEGINNNTPIIIYDLVGRKAWEKNFDNQPFGFGKIQVNITTFPPGMYFVRVNGSQTKRFIKR